MSRTDDKVDVLAIGAHPDDVELCCGGTLALVAGAGRRTGILHLSCGESGTRGSAEERRREAERAAEILGAAHLDFLDFGDGAMRTGVPEEDALVAVIRRRRPDLVLAPTPSDRHPDHGRAHRLVEDACYYAGLAARGTGTPHRPAAVFAYMQHDPFPPRFVVDVSSVWEIKNAALNAYESQLFQAGKQRDEPKTKVSSVGFRAAIEGRARHFGLMISATFGEPYWSRLPLAVADPFAVLPRGVR